jgi:hypothetical protein
VARAQRAYGEPMLILVIVLLVLWAILSVVGFAIKGLLWLAIIGIILFVATLIIGIIRRTVTKGRDKV